MLKGEIKELTKTLEIKNKLGMHARPAALLVKTCGQYISDVIFEKEGLQVNGKSILSVMTLAAPFGSKIIVYVKGPDAEEALAAIEKVFESKFNEE